MLNGGYDLQSGLRMESPFDAGQEAESEGEGGRQAVTPREVGTGKRKQNLAGKAWLGSACRDGVKHSGGKGDDRG